MKINKFLICVGLVIVLCLVYIHQETQIISLAYEGKKKSDKRESIKKRESDREIRRTLSNSL